MSKRLALRTALLLCALPLALAPPQPAAALDLAGTAWAAAAAPHGLDPTLLYAIGLMESGRPRDGGLAPWPWTLYLPGRGGMFLADRAQALSILRAHSTGAVDVGLMQINLRWHGHRVGHAEDLLEPARNLEIAAAILAETLASSLGDLELGVGRYHNLGEQRARAYGRTVLTIQERLHQLAGGARP